MRRDNKHTWKDIFTSGPALVVLLAIVVGLGVASWNMYQTNQQARDKLNRLQDERAILQARRDIASRQAQNLTTESGKKEKIRENFSVAKPGERVIILTDSRATDTPATTSTSTKSWLKRVKDWITP